MTVEKLMKLALEQAQLDAEDPDVSRDWLLSLANTAYDALTEAFRGSHLGESDDCEVPLRHDRDVPDVPEWCHIGICDYMSYGLLMAGGGTRPQRAQAFYGRWLDVLGRARMKGSKVFQGIPR